MNKLCNIINKPIRRVVGLMSGTSVDGIDAALVEIQGMGMDIDVKLISFENIPYQPEVRNRIFELFDINNSTAAKLGCMNFLLGELFAEAALKVIEKSGFKPSDIDFIGSHGQTIYHSPNITSVCGHDIRYTVQIGDGSVIANKTGIPCVTDFRTADMAAGGQGAPLVPFAEYLIYSRQDSNLLLLNIGGIANITVIPKGCAIDSIAAFDTGPGNMIIDGLCEIVTIGKSHFDKDGRIARSGRVSKKLLNIMKMESYFSLSPPKSTGREKFGREYIQNIYEFMIKNKIPAEDGLATAAFLTAWSVADAYKSYIMNKCPAHKKLLAEGEAITRYLWSLYEVRWENTGLLH